VHQQTDDQPRGPGDARRADAQARLARHQGVLRRIVRGQPLDVTLDGLCREIEERVDGTRCSVLLADLERGVLHHAAAPSLPQAYVEAIDGLEIAEGSGGCGTAAARRETVIVEDVTDDPLVDGFRPLLAAHRLRSLWSFPLLDAGGDPLGTFAVYRSVPHRPDADEIGEVSAGASIASLAIERARAEAALTEAAHVDALTQLPNRSHFLQRLGERLEASTDRLAVLFLDLDGFKWVNDSLGHPAGDVILSEVAERLRAVLRAGDVIGRFGGDEFTVMVDDADLAAVDLVAGRMRQAFVEPFELDGGEFFLSVSLGVALAEPGSTALSLIRDADAAMYAAKEAGRDRWVLFDDGHRRRAVERVTVEAELRRGIERGELTLHHQPFCDLRSGEWCAVEALARWQHPTRGLLMPDGFIPLAEETGLIVPLGAALLDLALDQAGRWARAGRSLPVSINLSVVQLADPNLPEELAGAMGRHGVRPEQVWVEVTETGLMERLDAARWALERIAELGVAVLIDDFGTGYSSIARLRELPVTGVKVDQGFVVGLGEDPAVARVLAAITDLAHALELRVVAEGIESEIALACARELGVDAAQGYHLARPGPASAIDALLP
jgi:c-di-GMP-specific phosphodiesterase